MARYVIVVKKDHLNQVVVDQSNPSKPVTNVLPPTEQQENANLENYTEVKDYINNLAPNSIFTEFAKYGVLGADLTLEQKTLLEQHPKVVSVDKEVLYNTCNGAFPPKSGGCCGGKCS